MPLHAIMQRISLLIATTLLLAAGGCASLPEEVGVPRPEEIAAAKDRLRGPVEEFDMLGITPEMRTFVDEVVPGYGFGEERLSRLFIALNDPEQLDIQYDAGASLTAAGVFEERRANCLAFAALFITLAREAGFNASFQEVDTPPTWLRSEDVLLRYLHVNTSVALPGRRRYVAEFREDRFDEHMLRRLITDEHALALHFNNVGVEHLVKNDLRRAGAYFVHAVETYPKLSIGWTNLGVVHRRTNRIDLAEISYRQALAIDPRSYSTMNNLAAIYEDRGKPELAARLRDMAWHERRKNPYYHYIRAQQAYSEADFESARGHLKSAIRRYGREHRFHHLMALTLRELGDEKKARESMTLAVENASKESDKARYQAMLDEWLGAGLTPAPRGPD